MNEFGGSKDSTWVPLPKGPSVPRPPPPLTDTGLRTPTSAARVPEGAGLAAVVL
jgi:hypothetical protein